jgi:hypothetical protein
MGFLLSDKAAMSAAKAPFCIFKKHKNRTFSLVFVLLHCALFTMAQEDTPLTRQERDSLFIEEFEGASKKPKVLHAEPLYIDLIRDLGAHKGEKEWNIGFGANDNLGFDRYEALIEYEWAPVDRLGLEVELPFEFFSPQRNVPNDSIPSGALKSLKLAAQWTFLVSESAATSMALGYINEFAFSDFDNWGNPLVKGNVYNPFLVAAKRWGSNFHTLIYTGPMVVQDFDSGKFESSYEINTNFHYMITGTRNFLGVEINQSLFDGELFTTLRPQMRLGISEHLLVGIVAGIPIDKRDERFSSFVRLIWEPGGRAIGH